MTHYDTLGVARDGSDAELRSAYRSRARALHPDLRGDRIPSARSRDDRAMQRLNEAWHVLGDPERRRTYDQALEHVGAESGYGEPATDPPWAHVDQRWPAHVLPLVALLGAIVACVIVACALVAAFVLLRETPRGGPERSADAPRAVTAGDCVTVRGGHVSEIVSCESPNDGQVVSEIPRGQSCATTTQHLVDGPSGSTFLCLDTAETR